MGYLPRIVSGGQTFRVDYELSAATALAFLTFNSKLRPQCLQREGRKGTMASVAGVDKEIEVGA